MFAELLPHRWQPWPHGAVNGFHAWQRSAAGAIFQFKVTVNGISTGKYGQVDV